jgi:UDP-N-acetylglucosamine 2-epimerase (non-hydrolysing)
VTLRYNTERPETIEVGANVLAGTKPENILEKAKIMINARRDWINPFGDGKAGNRIVNFITNSKKHT